MENMNPNNHSRSGLNNPSKRPLLWVATIAVILLVLAAMGAFKKWIPNSSVQSSAVNPTYSVPPANDRLTNERNLNRPTDPTLPKSSVSTQ